MIARRLLLSSIVARQRLRLQRTLVLVPPSTSTSTSTPLNECNFSSSTIGNKNEINNEESISSTTTVSDGSTYYIAVDHSQAYEAAMKGRHGLQLSLARLEGYGKDDPPFDPFADDDEEEDDDDEKLDGYEEDEGDEEENNNDNDDENDDDETDLSDSDELVATQNDDDGDDYDDNDISLYNHDGSVKRPKSVLATLRSGFPAGGYFAILELEGFQHKVTVDDLLVINRLDVKQYPIGSIHTTSQSILLMGSSHLTLVGMPYLVDASVTFQIEEHTQDAKVIVFKKRRRKHSQRKNGFRRQVTMIRIVDIQMPPKYQHHVHVPRTIIESLHESNENIEQQSITSSSSSSSSSSSNDTNVAQNNKTTKASASAVA